MSLAGSDTWHPRISAACGWVIHTSSHLGRQARDRSLASPCAASTTRWASSRARSGLGLTLTVEPNSQRAAVLDAEERLGAVGVPDQTHRTAPAGDGGRRGGSLSPVVSLDTWGDQAMRSRWWSPEPMVQGITTSVHIGIARWS